MASEILAYHGRLFTYMYRNLHPATVCASKGSDVSMSYSLKPNKYPFVLKSVNTKARALMVNAHITGAASMMPNVPYPAQSAMQ